MKITSDGQYDIILLAFFSIMLALWICIMGISYAETKETQTILCKIDYIHAFQFGIKSQSNFSDHGNITQFHKIYDENNCNNLFPFSIEDVIIKGEHSGKW